MKYHEPDNEHNNNDDEPRPRRPRRCSECGCIGSHAQGCPEQEDES